MKNITRQYDYQLLKGEIVKKYSTMRNFANDVLNITPTAFSRILKNKARFSQDSISLIVESLDLNPELIGIYFFTNVSQKNANSNN